ncbi:MAG TPA: SPOCS domain-containing protein [Feifaniaceae bacterium]|nr:SPOCS domain-containing protein [Feifaniaceae bacterium]
MEPIWSELQLERMAGRTAAQAFVEGDIPMPAGRDVQRILQTDAQIQNESARSADGRVDVDGTLTLQLLCISTEGEPFDVRASTRYNHSIPMEGAADGMRADVTPQLIDLRTALDNNRARLEAVADLNATVQQDENMRVITDVRNARNLQTRYEQTQLGRIQPIAQVSVRAREELEAPGVVQVLRVNAAPHVDSVTLEASGAAVEGTLYLYALYLDEERRLMQAMLRTPFSELIPLEMDAATCSRISAIPSVRDISGTVLTEGESLELSITLQLDVNCIMRENVTTLSDAYSADGGVDVERQAVDQLTPVSTVTGLCRITETLRVPDEEPDISRVIFASARPTVLGLTDSGGELGADGILVTSVVYADANGATNVFEEDIPFRCVVDAPYTSDALVRVRALEVRGTGAGRSVQVEYLLETQARIYERQQLQLAVGMEEAVPVSRENGIYVHMGNAGETLWDIGKRYGVTVAQIQEWNPEAGDALAEGMPVMIFSNSGRRRS